MPMGGLLIGVRSLEGNVVLIGKSCYLKANWEAAIREPARN